MYKPRIFFATVAAGGGHVATARAMAQALEVTYPGQFEIQVSDYMLELGDPNLRAFDARHKALWRLALQYPLAARWGQRLLDASPRLTNAVHRRLLRPFAAVIASDLERRAPALVVANHPFLTVSLTLAQRMMGRPNVPTLHFATEPLDASALWAEPDAARFIAPSEATRRDLVRMGVAAQKVDLVGYPVQQPFLSAPSKTEARRLLGLPDRFTCLFSAGSEGVSGNAERVVQALLGRGVHVVVMTGRNAELRARLTRLTPRGALTVEGFVDNMAEYVAACDLVVGKAGPASILEALAVGRPVLATSYAGLNERKLVRFLTERHLGAHVPTLDALTLEVARYRASPGLLHDATVRSAALEFPAMAEQCARYLACAATCGLEVQKERCEGRGLR